MSFTSLLTTITTLFLMMVVGYICGKLHVIDETASKNLSGLIVKVGQPFLVISSLICALARSSAICASLALLRISSMISCIALFLLVRAKSATICGIALGSALKTAGLLHI